MADIEFDSVLIAKFIYINIIDRETIRLECNLCNGNDYIFYEGSPRDASMLTVDWIGKAARHAHLHHPGKDPYPT